MKNISDIIEHYLKSILDNSKKGYIEIQRSELADKFQCVPSQINYVIKTRFTVEKGYVVESKRGGGGFIRIRKVRVVDEQRHLQTLLRLIEDDISQTAAEGIIDRLQEAELVTEREARLMKAVVQRNVLPFDVRVRDQLRAKLLKAMLVSLLYQ
ncbi:transcriptional repressor, CtsR [Caldalkalibacillus thermarum TA2.A1]|uniref:Transcriptional regulator CtsR n=1 Tax=Caldalkalibacillus thermarum (strain TA2.A1) TaxID=986075 RepID=F5L593_CALTT|nr:CtsR family transcriptional regulator [Caldalkalibacillus thermarum]EGL83491.1 transcriptional repressor, CtsR [Caldalkalibacillus thermarum TA2.A1]QZT34387.1 CtsR family transcriptional regulator [Caldalkalibacillus thermarum TA2.A1]